MASTEKPPGWLVNFWPKTSRAYFKTLCPVLAPDLNAFAKSAPPLLRQGLHVLILNSMLMKTNMV